MNFVSASIYQKGKQLAFQEGLNPFVLRAHQEEVSLQQNEAYIPISLLFDLYEAADEYLAPGFAVRQGRQLVSQDYGTLGMAWRTCWNAQDILARTARFMVLVTDHGSAQWQERGGQSILSLERIAIRRGAEMANETALVMLVNVMREVCQKNIQPSKVYFKHQSNATHEFEKFFECPVHFDSSKNELYFENQDVRIPTVKADIQLQNFLVERMKEEQESINSQADHLLKSIKSLIQESLPSGIPSLIQVAEHVNLSPRTLKRRLAEKSKSFRELVQEIQEETALDLLLNSHKSLSEITFLTGFSELSAFNRAFKRWKGEAPSSYRSSIK